MSGVQWVHVLVNRFVGGSRSNTEFVRKFKYLRLRLVMETQK